jgi:type IV pilus assembly protein PilB
VPVRPVASQDGGEQTVRLRLGDVLVSRGVLTGEQLSHALDQQRERSLEGNGRRIRLGALLVELGLADEQQIAESLGQLLGREVVDAVSTPIDPELARRLPRVVAERSQVLPLGLGERGLRVLAADPTDVLALDDVRRHTDFQQLDVLIGTPTQLRALVNRVWSLVDGDMSAASTMAEPDEDDGESDDVVLDAPTVRLVDSLLAEAVRLRASDVHIEQQRTAVRVRYRIDGVLRDALALPRSVGRSLVARIKIVAGMDIAERRIPQDGRLRLTVDRKILDARVSSLPSIHGEKIVVRLLQSESTISHLPDLGLDDQQQADLTAALAAAQGLVLITGPTGSGKTSTLYAAIRQTITPARNVVTLEDPVEIELAGITQVAIDERSGMTFARGLRSVLRQDPDVILVGEVRDLDTAELAMRAALTGHLVLTTLHTNDAASALPRLFDMGAPGFLVASALRLVAAQRLVRVVCPTCAEPYQPEEATLTALGLDEYEMVEDGVVPMRGRGCRLCDQTGFVGRRGVFEVLVVTPALRRRLLERPTESEVFDVAREQGFTTMREHGLSLARQGITTYEEVLRVTAG